MPVDGAAATDTSNDEAGQGSPPPRRASALSGGGEGIHSPPQPPRAGSSPSCGAQRAGSCFIVVPTREALASLESELRRRGTVFERKNVMPAHKGADPSTRDIPMPRQEAHVLPRGKTLHSLIESAKRERKHKYPPGAFLMAFNHVRPLSAQTKGSGTRRTSGRTSRGRWRTTRRPAPTRRRSQPSEFENDQFNKEVVSVNGAGAYKVVYGFAVFRDQADWEIFKGAKLTPEQRLAPGKTRRDSLRTDHWVFTEQYVSDCLSTQEVFVRR